MFRHKSHVCLKAEAGARKSKMEAKGPVAEFQEELVLDSDVLAMVVSTWF